MNNTVANQIHYAALGLFLEYKKIRWGTGKVGKEVASLKFAPILKGLKERKIKYIDMFLWVEDKRDNAYISRQGPFRKEFVEGRRVFTTNVRRRFINIFIDFCELLKEYNLRPIFTLSLRGDYIRDFLRKNSLDMGMSDVRYWETLALLREDLADIIETVYGDTYKSDRQWWKFFNEVTHQNRDFGPNFDAAGHAIAEAHLYIHRHTAQGVDRLIIDKTGSDFAKAHFAYKSICPYGCGEWFGGRPGLLDSNGRVIATMEEHGKSIAQNLGKDYKVTCQHPLYPNIRTHEDGGGGPEAKGYAVGGFRVGNLEQTRVFGTELWGVAHSYNKDVVHGFFPLTCLVRQPNGEYQEDFTLETADLERLDVLIETHDKEYR